MAVVLNGLAGGVLSFLADSSALSGALLLAPASFSHCDWYRMADVHVGVESEDVPLRQRFRELYDECLSSSPPASGARLHCSIRQCRGSDVNLVVFGAPRQISVIDMVLSVFPDRGYVEMQCDCGDWRFLGLNGEPRPILAARDNLAVVDTAAPSWRAIIANVLVNWAMWMQPDTLFFHAAAVAIGGRGAVISGVKGSGKSTLSLALAARGHAFFADEIAVVRKRTRELAPFRRAVSIREGPQSPRVEKLLRTVGYSTERYPDGTVRIRANEGELFPSAVPLSSPLLCVFFLRAFGDRPRVQAFIPRVSELKLLAPFACTYFGRSPAQLMMQVANLLSNVHCYFLHPGMPDDTACLVEQTVEKIMEA